MADDTTSQADKTEPATPKRREDAREKGQVAQSKEIQSVLVMAAAVFAMGSGMGTALLLRLARVGEMAWGGQFVAPRGINGYAALLQEVLLTTGVVLVPILVLLAAVGTAGYVAQTGPLFSMKALAPKASRMNPLKGLKKFVEPDRLFDLAKSLFKLCVVCSITWFVLRSALDPLMALIWTDFRASVPLARDLAVQVAASCLLFLGIMGAADLLYQRYRHEQKLKMTIKEVREEMKDREGNPQVRGRMKRMQQELSRSRMIQAVSDASVVVTNPTHFAVALLYEAGMSAPMVLAKGRNHVALRIRAAAEEADVPIVENPPLARMLHGTVKVGKEIPEDLFQAVAEVLAYVARIDPRRALGWSGGS